MARTFVVLLTSLLLIAVVVATVVAIVVLLVKGAIKQFTGVSEDLSENPEDTGSIPRHMLRYTIATLCDVFPVVHATRQLGAGENVPKFFVEEDDWRQVEFVPTTIRAAIHEEVALLSKFKVDKWDGSGWTDLYIRREYPDGLSSIGLPFKELSNLLASWHRHDLPIVRVDPNGITIAKVDESFLFEASEKAFFYGEAHDGSVNVLALSVFGQGLESYPKLIEKLAELGGAFPLLMVDWNSGVVVDLCSPEEIRRWVGGISSAGEGSTPSGL